MKESNKGSNDLKHFLSKFCKYFLTCTLILYILFQLIRLPYSFFSESIWFTLIVVTKKIIQIISWWIFFLQILSHRFFYQKLQIFLVWTVFLIILPSSVVIDVSIISMNIKLNILVSSKCFKKIIQKCHLGETYIETYRMTIKSEKLKTLKAIKKNNFSNKTYFLICATFQYNCSSKNHCSSSSCFLLWAFYIP